jgi:DNA processing protein
METSASTIALMRLQAVRGVGAARVRKVIESARGRSEGLPALVARPGGLRGVLNDQQLDELSANEAAIARHAEDLRAQGVRVIGWHDHGYPERLRRRLGPPILMVRGEVALLDRSAVGFCGSRKASGKGLTVAGDCADQLAQAGVDVVSGYAAGVDLCAHRAALQAGGVTTIVLAEGILQFRIKRELEDVWDWTRVCVVSEFAPQTRWTIGNAMQRNATICGLSDAMILIESRSTGGSIAAGRSSLAMGVPLFVAEYDGMPEWADGNRELLAGGAMPLRKSRATNRASLDRVFGAMRESSGETDAAGSASPPRLAAQTTLFGQ